MRALLAADGSEHGTAALRTACRILSTKDRCVDLLCIAPRVNPRKVGLQERVERHAQRIAERVSEIFAEEGVSTKPRVHIGSAARVLIGCSPGYDIVVAAAQSHRGTSTSGLGPVASRMLEHARSSVLLARGTGAGTPMKVLIPVDGSEGALRGLEKLQSLVDLTAAEVTLMHVVETPWVRPVDDQEWLSLQDDVGEEPNSDFEREFTQEAETLMEAARDRLPQGTAVSTMIDRGIPTEQILSEADTGEYDLIVLSATGERDLKHRILGSVSSKVAWSAPCSVLLVHSGD